MMESSHLDPAFTSIRREKKAVKDENWTKSFLKQAPAGVLATVFQDQPFLSTKMFVYDESRHVIYLHSANEGRVFTNVQENPKVCFTAFRMGRILPAAHARGFGVEYESVVVFGQIKVVETFDEMLIALQQTMDKYAPHLHSGEDYPPIDESELNGLAVYRLEISAWSAKRDQGLPDNPGAFRFEDILSKG